MMEAHFSQASPDVPKPESIPKYVESTRVVQAVILGSMQESGASPDHWHEFARVLRQMYEDTRKETLQQSNEFRALFAGITAENMYEPDVQVRIARIQKLVEARMEQEAPRSAA